MNAYHPRPKWVIWMNETESGVFPYDESGLAERIIDSLRNNGVECFIYDLKENWIDENDVRITDGTELPTISECEKRLLVMALENSGGSQKKAAKKLGISARAVHYKIKKFGLVKYKRDVAQSLQPAFSKKKS